MPLDFAPPPHDFLWTVGEGARCGISPSGRETAGRTDRGREPSEPARHRLRAMRRCPRRAPGAQPLPLSGGLPWPRKS